MKNIVLIIVSLFCSMNIFAQATIDDFEGVFSYKDNEIEIVLEIKKVFYDGTNKDILLGNTFLSINNQVLIKHNASIKSKINTMELLEFYKQTAHDTSHMFADDKGYCIIYFNKAKQIFTLTKQNNTQYVLEYSESITNSVINSPNVAYFRNIVPEYELPKKIILTKQRK